MREKPVSWLPFDSRLLPIDFSLRTPHTPFVKALLITEMVLAFISVVGALLLAFWPRFPFGLNVNPSSFCQAKTDCLLAIRVDQCCDCPKGYLKETVASDPGLIVYESKKDYRHLKPRDCRQVFCPACSFYTQAFCCNGECRGTTLLGATSK